MLSRDRIGPIVCGALLGCTVAVPSAAGPIDDLLTDGAAARSFDYCAWRFEQGGNRDEVPDLEPLLEGGAPKHGAVRSIAAALVHAGVTIALESDDPRSCKQAFANGTKQHERSRSKMLKKLGRQAKFDADDDPKIAEVQQRISDLWAEDQAARQVYISTRDLGQGAELWERRLAYAWATEVDAQTTAYMKQVVEQFDWIDAHRFGVGISAHAWLLVQHADAHPEFQQQVLERMEPYLADGGVRKRDYAYLWDRVAVNHGRKQRYGTQPDWNCVDGKLQLRPMEDPDNVDARRAEMGLGSAQDQLEAMSRSVCGG